MPEKPPITATSTPRERFLNDATTVRQHRSIVDGDAFVKSSDAVMLEYVRKLAGETNPSNAAVCGLKQQGAQEFLDLFKAFAEQPKPLPKRPGSENLKPTDPRR